MIPVVWRRSQRLHQEENDSKIGYLSHYYSEVVVCERCYDVYRQLDYLRGNKQRQWKQENKAIKEKELYDAQGVDNYAEYARDVEKRIFNQRKFVSRLNKPKKVIVEEDPDDYDFPKEQSIAGSSVYTGGGLATNGSIASIQPEGSYFPYHSYFEQEAEADKKRKKDKKGISGASKGILPPLPWQLGNDANEQAEYVNTRANKNKFVKNISNRIAYENDRIGNLGDDSVKQHADSNWLHATGQSNDQMRAKRRGLAHSNSADSVVRKNKPKVIASMDVDRLLHLCSVN